MRPDEAAVLAEALGFARGRFSDLLWTLFIENLKKLSSSTFAIR
jgi:hypothetical protein